MKRWRNKFLSLAGVAALAMAIPAASQEAPESLLPPGFDDPSAPLPQRQNAPPPSRPQAPAASSVAAPAATGGEDGAMGIENSAATDLDALSADIPKPIEIPDMARRPIDMVGPLTPGNWGLQSNAFGHAHGVFLSTLMRRLEAPVASRWTSILLRRALLSRMPAPHAVSPVDWVAERAWLLLRMGEADAARMLVQSIDVDQFTPKMFGVAVQTALATADPAGLCPLVEPGKAVSDEPVWPLAEAMCAALEGEPTRAGALIDQARRHSGAGGVDLALAEKVIGAGENSRRAATIEWDPVDRLNSWRFGLASATGLTIPDRLLNQAGPRVRAWQARAAMLPLDQRLESSDVAAALGVFSNASLVEIYSLLADTTDPSEMATSIGGRLRLAYIGSTVDRMAALRGLWDKDDSPSKRYARLILTASAAGRIEPSDALASDVPDLIAAMLSAGLDREAARWSKVVGNMSGSDADRAWALLALASARPGVDIRASRFSDFADNDESVGQVRSKLLLAGLAGLDRLDAKAQADLASDLGLSLNLRNRWTVMIDSAAERGQPGTVALLAAVGMQTGDWRGVPPAYLYHIVRDLRRAGLEYEARMIAAEALSRV